ncbi:MAG: HD-GYP domain-containing protein [Gammaproteobacteria bacterium]|nr:HD-GYP domain-containing protein [Gammaproteobacteria bacterium]
MLQKRVKIDTADLECGMYVSQLDRPWLETPFLFQGFEIQDDKDLKLLRKTCKHVYVDATRGAAPREKVLHAHQKKEKYEKGLAVPDGRREHVQPPSLQWRLFDAIARLDSSGSLAARFLTHKYDNAVATKIEAPKATLAYDAAAAVMNDVLGQFDQGKGLDAGKLKVAISPMIDSVMRNQDAMAWLVQLRKRDAYTYHHSLASSVWAVVLGRHLGFDRAGLDTLAMGGLLLDLGKAQIPADILVKEGPLDEVEKVIVRKHVAVGVKLVRTTPGVNADVIAMIEGHHERHDGSGYPNGLAGADIPVFGRIAGLIDSFDAMTTKRPYAPAKSAYDAIRELNGLAGKTFQRELVEQFVQALGMFPTGSLVELNTGEVAIVIEQNRVRRLRPKLMLLLNNNKLPVAAHTTIDLRKLPAAAGESGARWITRGLDPGAYGLDPKDFFG